MNLFILLLFCVFLQNVSSDDDDDDRNICEVSHLKDLLWFSKTEDKKYQPEECWISEHVKSLLDAMGVVGKVIGDVANLNYSCFTVTVNVRFGRDIKYRGCMPQGMCKIVEKVFGRIKSTGGIKGMITRFLFPGSKCAECYGINCNAPLQRRALSFTNSDLSCEVSPLKTIIYSANLEDLSYRPRMCVFDKNVTSLLNRFENVGLILPERNAYRCFTMTVKKTIDEKTFEIRGCVPKGDCMIVEKIFKQIPVMDYTNRTIKLFKEAKCKECDGDMCNTPTEPKGELALAPVRHLSAGLILLVFVQFLV